MKYAIRRSFEEVGAHRIIYLEVLESNHAARRLYEAVGFRGEGLYRDGYLDESGAFRNLVPYGMLVSDFRAKESTAETRSLGHVTPSPFSVRRFTKADLTAIKELDRQAFSSDDQYNDEMYERFGAEDHRTLVAVSTGGEIAGYVLLDIGDEPVRLRSLAVHTSYRRAGCGSELMRASLREVPRSVDLSVAPENIAAITLYKRFGFSFADNTGEMPSRRRMLRCAAATRSPFPGPPLHCGARGFAREATAHVMDGLTARAVLLSTILIATTCLGAFACTGTGARPQTKLGIATSDSGPAGESVGGLRVALGTLSQQVQLNGDVRFRLEVRNVSSVEQYLGLPGIPCSYIFGVTNVATARSHEFHEEL